MTGYESTTFTLDIIGRNVCNTIYEVESTLANGVDLVVIGSGMYGGYVASTVAQYSSVTPGRIPLRVIVLEAGPLVALEHAQNLPDVGLNTGSLQYIGPGSNPPVQAGVWGQGWRSFTDYTGQAYCVGGKSIYWGGWTPRQSVDDLKNWPTEIQHFFLEKEFHNPQPYSKIPKVIGAYEVIDYQIGTKPSEDFIFDENTIRAKEVEGGLNKVLYSFFQTRQKSGAIDVSTSVAPIAVSTRSDASGLFANNKYSSVPGVVASVRRNSDRISLVPNCHVSKLISAPAAEGLNGQSRVITQLYVNYKGDHRYINIPSYAQVVLAGSAIESTRLALESFSLVNSGLVPPGGELIGNNLHTHERFDFTFRFPRKVLDDFAKQELGLKLSDLLQVTTLHVSHPDPSPNPTHSYQYQLFSASNTLQSQSPDDLLYRLIPDITVADYIAEHQDSNLITIILRASGQMPTNRTSNRDAGSWVDLASLSDYDKDNDNYRAWVEWKNHDNDPMWKTMWDKAVEISLLFKPPAGQGDLEYWIPGLNSWGTDPPALDGNLRQGLGTTYHDSGTLWMGEDYTTSVTDTNGHFHHVTNVYGTDQAVFPTCAVANPVPTGLVVARKVAYDILERHDFFPQAFPTPPDGEGFTPLLTSQVQYNSEWQLGGIGYFNLLKIDPNDATTWILETVPQPNGIGFLRYIKQEYSDFELRVQWKAFRNPFEEANSGVFVRAPDPTPYLRGQVSQDDFYDALTEIQIDDSGKQYRGTDLPSIYGNSLYKTGAIYGVTAPQQWAQKIPSPEGTALYWNEYRLIFQGPKGNVFLNGKQIIKDALLPKEKLLNGYIALQVHTGKVQFRNIRIKPLVANGSSSSAPRTAAKK